jgi:hypothetical protein
MAGEKERVTDTATAQKEAAEDAKLIKEGDSSKSSYQLFKDEVEAMERSGVDESVRRQYRSALKEQLGTEMDRVVIDFLNSDDAADLKNKNGAFTLGQIGAMNNDDATDVQRALLPQVMLRFDDIAGTVRNDGQGRYGSAPGISERDLEQYTANQDKRDELAGFAATNREDGYNTLLDRKFMLNWDAVDIRGNFIGNGKDGLTDRDAIEDYLNDANTAEGIDKDRYPAEFVEKMQQLYDNWDTPEVKAMTVGGRGDKISLDSIAKGLGYESLEDAREQQAEAPEVEEETAETEEAETSEMTLKYEDGKVERTFTFDADQQMTAFSETRDGKTTSYKVDPEHGEATNAETGEAFGRVHVDRVTGNVTIHETDKEEVMVKPDTPPEQETVAQTDLKIEDFSAAATQQAGQGYWQVAENVLEATKSAEESAEDTRAQNIVLMRALQMQHRQQGGGLSQHKFIANESDLAKLNANIDAYIEEHPSFAKYKESLHKRLAMVEAAS